MKKYIYGMRLRGCSPGCQPSKGLIQRMDDETGTYWDLIEYDRPLDAEEIAHYSLDFLREEPGIRYRITTETGSEWGAFSSRKEAEEIAERFSRKYGPSHYDIIERTLQEIAGE